VVPQLGSVNAELALPYAEEFIGRRKDAELTVLLLKRNGIPLKKHHLGISG
jgi:hypothetical protein